MTNVVHNRCFITYKWYKYITKDTMDFVRSDFKLFKNKKIQRNNICTPRHEDILGRFFNLTNSVLDDGIAARESFRLQNLKYLFSSVILLLVILLVRFDQLLYPIKIGAYLGFFDRFSSLIAWRLTVVPDFS